MNPLRTGPEERIRFRNLLADFANERLVLLSTHIVSDVEATTNRIGILDHGRPVFNGTTDELIDAAAGMFLSVTYRWRSLNV